MVWLKRLLRWGLILLLVGVLMGCAAVGVAYWLIAPRLPDAAQIRDIKLQVPLRVMSRDAKLIAVIGEAHRTPVKIGQIPEQLRKAFIATEDARFYDHPGIDAVGIVRAVWLLATSEDKRVPGGSTITQQVARNYFLSSEYSYTRKLSEMFLALRLERELSKDEILELYLNKIFFGYRSYGVAAAADFYYGKTLDQLTLAECATLASIPKFPSSGNPLSNPERALERRNYVLQRMFEVKMIDQAAFKAAVADPEHARPHEPPIELEAPHLAEMVRQVVIDQFGSEVLSNGSVAWTTVESRLQSGANDAVREGLKAYDRRHGYRGPARHVELPPEAGPKDFARELSAERTIVGLVPALVLSADKERAELVTAEAEPVELTLAAMSWAKKYLSENSRGPAPKQPADVLKRGDIVRLARDAEGQWMLAQMPAAQSALVSLDTDDGAVRALVGGLSFTLSKFNRAIQSSRQPGSSFKPFLYSAAFEHGFTPATLVNDAPLAFPDISRPDGVWRPGNDDEKFEGPVRLRDALVRSRNTVSVRVLEAIGVKYARDYITRFGVPLAAMPENLSMALGTSSVAPIMMARGFGVFANGGYLVDPYFLERVENDAGKVLFRAQPKRVCRACSPQQVAAASQNTDADQLAQALGLAPAPTPAPPPEATSPSPDLAATPDNPAPRVLDERIAFLVRSLMHDVITRGTGSGALVLKRNDLAGKTGTTNEHRDGWFTGYNDRIVTSVWTGFDDFSSLGKGEFGAQVALPAWIAYMRVALDGTPEEVPPPPPGIATAHIDPASGMILDGDGGIVEYFRADDLPRLMAQRSAGTGEQGAEAQGTDIF